MVILENASIDEKLKILADSAKYDVAGTSSGVERKAEKGSIGSTCASGICHSFAADGRCISLLKVLYTNNANTTADTVLTVPITAFHEVHFPQKKSSR